VPQIFNQAAINPEPPVLPPAPTPVAGGYSTVDLPPIPPVAPTQQRRSPLVKLLVIALVLFLALGLTILAGILYVGYRVGQKASHLARDISRATGDRAGNPQHSWEDLFHTLSPGDDIPILTAHDPVTPCPPFSFPAQDTARVPLKPGTVLTNAWGVKYGDVEITDTIQPSDASGLSVSDSNQSYKDDVGDMVKQDSHTNRNCNADFHSAATYITVNSHNLPSLLHDVTRFRLSDKTFQEIKTSGKTTLRYMDVWNVPGGVKPTYESGTLTRVEPKDVDHPMIVNDQRVNLPAIHLAGNFETEGKDPRPQSDRPSNIAAELYVLDDPADPLVLTWRLKHPSFHAGNFRVEVVKIGYPVAKPDNVLEKQLTEQKRAVTYGIYFDFAQATLKPESAPVLKEIAQAMTDNPDWKLTVEGHTDSIGGDAYNLDLSKRRALSVKEALVAQYNIAADRLANDGFGSSRPVESNETLEGRARNRRVELVRQ
jgi:outer membrane protein OmpA-like peptidoglycan-associated protein